MTTKTKQVLRVLQGGLSDKEYIARHNGCWDYGGDHAIWCPNCSNTNCIQHTQTRIIDDENNKRRDFDTWLCENCKRTWYVLCRPEAPYEADRLYMTDQESRLVRMYQKRRDEAREFEEKSGNEGTNRRSV